MTGSLRDRLVGSIGTETGILLPFKGAGSWEGQVNMGLDPSHIFKGAAEELQLVRTARVAHRAAAAENIQLAQKGVRRTFTTKEEGSRFKYEGMSITEVVEGLRKGTISPDELPIEFVVIGEERFAVNNRSLLALRRAQLQPTVTKDVTGDGAKLARVRERLSEIDRLGLPRDTTMIRGGPPNSSRID